VQWYAYTPTPSNRCEKCAPPTTSPESSDPVSEVTVWVRWLTFVHDTVSPGDVELRRPVGRELDVDLGSNVAVPTLVGTRSSTRAAVNLTARPSFSATPDR
jgi:hypothetical protein